jgi:hypothetical protein
MAITIISSPTTRESAYRPLKYTFKSNLYNNSLNGERQTAFGIGHPTTNELLNNPTIISTDVLLRTTPFPQNSISVGQHIRLTNIYNGTEPFYMPNTESDGTRYGVFRVKQVLNNNLFVIDAEWEVDWVGFGLAPQAVKFYNNFQIGLKVYAPSKSPLPIDEFRLKPLGVYQDSIFEEDIKGALQPYLGAHLEPLAASANGWLTTNFYSDAVDDISLQYYIEYWEIYDVPTNGINYLTSQRPSIHIKKVAINAIKPQITFNEGGMSRIFTTALDTDFTLDGTVKKFLTNAPLTQWIKRDQYASLSYLATEPSIRLVCKTYPNHDLGGTIIATTTTSTINTGVSGQVLVGPKNIGTSRITAATKSYQIYLEDGSGTQLTEKRTYNIDDNCYFDSVQFFFLNQLGGMDQYSFNGHSYEKYQTKPAQFRQQQATSFPTSNDVTYDVMTKQTLTIGTRASRVDADWLKELFSSTRVYVIPPNTDEVTLNEFVPVIVSDQTITPIDTRNRGSVVIECKYRYAFDLISQQG